MTTPGNKASRDDLEALKASESLRSALSDQLTRDGADVLSLALHTGRILALHGGSSLLATQVAHETSGGNEVVIAALVEGFARGREELGQRRVLERMRAPVVDAGGAAYTVFCAFEPDDDLDLSEWADGIVRHLRKQGAKRILVGGAPHAAEKVREAAALVGIETTLPVAARTEAAHPESAPATWQRFWPFRGRRGKE